MQIYEKMDEVHSKAHGIMYGTDERREELARMIATLEKSQPVFKVDEMEVRTKLEKGDSANWLVSPEAIASDAQKLRYCDQQIKKWKFKNLSSYDRLVAEVWKTKPTTPAYLESVRRLRLTEKQFLPAGKTNKSWNAIKEKNKRKQD